MKQLLHPEKVGPLADSERLPTVEFPDGVRGWIEPHNALSLALGYDARRKVIRDRIIKNSTQQEIMKRCPNDYGRRFTDASTMARWALEAETRVLSLSPMLDLAGIVFFRRKEHADTDCDVTFGIRIYDGYAGRGLARPFMEIAHCWLQMNDDFNAENGVWLETDVDNAAAVAAYERFGYKLADTQSTENRLLMEYHK